MNKNKAVFIASLLLACSASYAQEAATPADAEAAPVSRLRMFGQNGALATLSRDSSCAKGLFSDGVEKASGGLGSAFSSFLGNVSNTSLGMPDTETTLNLTKKNGMLSKAYFREYVIPAGKPSTMSMGFKDVSSFYVFHGIRYSSDTPSCKGQITFVPRAGEDYEAAFIWEGKICSLSVNQIVVKEGKTELIAMPVTRAPDC